ncbi:hypothetical protein C5B42_04685 [Candidatus Cerribacteria bacterium 'Amazon FNV 2010 28 9']|uniref:FAD:protein FMN transferase n=1 Tax=Candidatus Cerribacteria bacterium 'Amazon FNV 2010 28 9' TaxID=2081795 RepID=A0A317JMP6_9BACT|nr:MAG: hypothetical protein C5B42_04685 [Candidatus Cerribacteria bacterium 'Amazon FNV 2010 28 9']
MTRNFSLQFEAIGTRWRVDVYEPVHERLCLQIKEKIFGYIECFESTYSRFRTDSRISQLAQKKGKISLSSDEYTLFSLYERLYRLTNGIFTPLIGNLLVEAGYDETYSLQPSELHSPPDWDNVLSVTDTTLELCSPALIDIGAAGKGYLIDRIGEILHAEGIHSFCVDGSGDLLVSDLHGEKLEVGLEHPLDTTQVIGIVRIQNESLCASAGNRRKWGQFHHIIDPHTLESPSAILATFVVAKHAMLADALSTCLFLVPSELLLHEFSFEYALVRDDLSLEVSPKFPGHFFTSASSID